MIFHLVIIIILYEAFNLHLYFIFSFISFQYFLYIFNITKAPRGVNL
nr:MAG TPA: hypothetical protein [Caudoviricetes sp.]